MQRLGWLFGGVVLAIVLSVSLTASGGRFDDDSSPRIASVVVSADQVILFVAGSNFDRRSVLTIGDFSLGGVQVSPDGRSITALMPAVPPGTYRLVITRPGDS